MEPVCITQSDIAGDVVSIGMYTRFGNKENHMAENQPSDIKVHCGIVMPISAMDECTAEHWTEVKSIICEACESIEVPTFEAKLVSEDDAVGVIHKRIIQNVYTADIVVCDLSSRNPNVMFEAGLRLAFDKATVLIKDDKTPYSFDTQVIEHIEYPRSLRFGPMVAFKARLADKILNTYNASKQPDYSTFLKNFGQFQTIKLDEKVAPVEGVILEMLGQLQRELSILRADSKRVFPDKNHTFSPVHSKAIPELIQAVSQAEQKFGKEFWKKPDGVNKLMSYLDSETECEAYWGGREVFLKVVIDHLKSLVGRNGKSGLAEAIARA
jgi:hypothetical protein